MQATYVPERQDKLSFEEAAAVFRDALTTMIGRDPAPAVLGLVLAKTGLESGRWGATGGLHNFGFGNIKASDTYAGSFTCITLNEVMPAGLTWYAPEGQLNRKGGTVIGKVYPVPDGHPQTRMRAYATPTNGAFDYCRFVAGGRYKGAWALLLDGDAAGYVHALKLAKYFTADETAYAKGVISLQREFVAKLSGLPHTEPAFAVPDPEVVREWLSPMDIAQLEAELDDRYFETYDMNKRDGTREMSDDGESFPPPPNDLEPKA